jgi:hypothetical protein
MKPRRLEQVAILLAMSAVCWLGVMAVHELGHVLAAWVSGGTVREVVLHPTTISRTDVEPNPAPLFVVWAGPIVGVALPLLVFGLARRLRPAWAYLFGFFAGFCLIANGAYIGLGAIDGIGDAGVMHRHGTPDWVMAVFGVACCATGLLLWHRASPAFGLGHNPRPIDRRHAIVVSIIAVVIYAATWLLGNPGTR